MRRGAAAFHVQRAHKRFKPGTKLHVRREMTESSRSAAACACAWPDETECLPFLHHRGARRRSPPRFDDSFPERISGALGDVRQTMQVVADRPGVRLTGEQLDEASRTRGALQEAMCRRSRGPGAAGRGAAGQEPGGGRAKRAGSRQVRHPGAGSSAARCRRAGRPRRSSRCRRCTWSGRRARAWRRR